MEGINEERLVEAFLQLLRINAPSLAERPVADYLKEQFSRLELKTEEDDVATAIGGDCGNILVRVPGSNPAAPGLIFSAHLDTILPTAKIRVIEKDGRFCTDGSTILGADNRAGVAAVLELARTLTEEGGSPVPLEFLFTVAEERGLLGVKGLRKGWLGGKMAYILDCDGPVGRVVQQAPFGQKVRVTVRGKAAHAGSEPAAGISAIVIASRAISRMKLGQIDERTTANIGLIEGGEAQNIVPERVEVVGEARSLDENLLRRQVEHMESVFQKAAAELGGGVEFRSERDYPGYLLGKDSPVVQLVFRAAARLGLKVVLQSSGGASDANFINALGIPALDLSVGYVRPHTKEENISREELIKAAQLAYEIVKQAGKS